jgi:hypothetical protein
MVKIRIVFMKEILWDLEFVVTCSVVTYGVVRM